MNITLGIYDLFTYAVPGSLYLALLTYASDRLAWISPSRILHTDPSLVFVAALVASYLIGHATYKLGNRVGHAYSGRRDRADIRYATREFVERVPAAHGRVFLEAHLSALQAAVEVQALQAAAEIVRLRAIGLMLRNSAPALLLGTLAAIANSISGKSPVASLCAGLLLAFAAFACLSRSQELRRWSRMKTLELAYWIPDIDEGLTASTTHHADGSALNSASRSRVRRSSTPAATVQKEQGSLE